MNFTHLSGELRFSLRHPRVRTGVVVFAVSVLFMLSVAVFYYWPIAHNSTEFKSALEDQKREINLAEYNAKLAKISGRALVLMNQIDKKLDASVTQGVLVQNIAELARQNKVKIVSESYEEGKVINGYAPLIHQLMVQAGYSELREFVYGLQRMPSLTITQEANLSRVSDTSIIKAQLNIITYRREKIQVK